MAEVSSVTAYQYAFGTWVATTQLNGSRLQASAAKLPIRIHLSRHPPKIKDNGGFRRPTAALLSNHATIAVLPRRETACPLLLFFSSYMYLAHVPLLSSHRTPRKLVPSAAPCL
jgi:hypothetical protein